MSMFLPAFTFFFINFLFEMKKTLTILFIFHNCCGSYLKMKKINLRYLVLIKSNYSKSKCIYQNMNRMCFSCQILKKKIENCMGFASILTAPPPLEKKTKQNKNQNQMFIFPNPVVCIFNFFSFCTFLFLSFYVAPICKITIVNDKR